MIPRARAEFAGRDWEGRDEGWRLRVRQTNPVGAGKQPSSRWKENVKRKEWTLFVSTQIAKHRGRVELFERKAGAGRN